MKSTFRTEGFWSSFVNTFLIVSAFVCAVATFIRFLMEDERSTSREVQEQREDTWAEHEYVFHGGAVGASHNGQRKTVLQRPTHHDPRQHGFRRVLRGRQIVELNPTGGELN